MLDPAHPLALALLVQVVQHVGVGRACLLLLQALRLTGESGRGGGGDARGCDGAVAAGERVRRGASAAWLDPLPPAR